MEEHGVSWENMANMENMENMENITIWLKTLFYDSKHKHYIYDSKQSICDWNTLFVNQMTQNTLFYGIYGDGWKIITYALGEHDLQVSSRWENIKRNVEPWVLREQIFKVCTRLCLLVKGLPGTTNAGLLKEPPESENLFEQVPIFTIVIAMILMGTQIHS